MAEIHTNSEVLKLYRNQSPKPPRTSRTLPLKTKNIQSKIIQVILLDLKVHWNQAQMPL